ncbi:hypothetical protein JW859_12015 [bacterium]|nr:hypothetical protein [bacterium]
MMKKSSNSWMVRGLAAALAVLGLVGGLTARAQDETGAAQPAAEPADSAPRFVEKQSAMETCLLCHGKYNLIIRIEGDPRHSLWLDQTSFYKSAHSSLHCSECHTNIDQDGHRLAPADVVVQCAPCHDEAQITAEGGKTPDEIEEDFKHMLEVTGFSTVKTVTLQACFQCHPDEYYEYRDSAHGASAMKAGYSDAPTCIDCHGSHSILPSDDERSPTNILNIPVTCLRCHDEKALQARAGLERNVGESFKESFHGRRGELGGTQVAVCSNCHGTHAIYPSSDPRSKVNKTRIARTCGECHEGAQLNFASAFTHKTVSPREQLGLYILKQIYKWVIFLLIAQFVVFAALDIFQTFRHRRRDNHAKDSANV